MTGGAKAFLRNMSILGSPGSGKGFYGKPLAQRLGIPLFTVSNILREDKDLLEQLDSGALVDCHRVCQTLHEFLMSPSLSHKKQQGGGGFLMDGFPRTLVQIHLMQEQWPLEIQIQTAVHIHVPDFVCKAKILGRRICQFCDRPLNVVAVHEGGFDLPELLPKQGECHNNNNNSRRQCRPGVAWWTQRKDDADPAVVKERLRLHREHEQPILDHYKQHNHLFTYTPFRGYPDIPDIQESLEKWLEEHESIANC